MKVLHSSFRLTAVFASVYTALFIAAIPLLCVSVGTNIPLLVICIVVLGAGLGLLPLLWVQFGLLLSLFSITSLIEKEQIYELDDIAARLRFSKDKAAKRIKRLLRYSILPGYYYFDGVRVHPTFRLGE